MSLAVTHFAVGAAAMVLIQSLWWPNCSYPRTVVVASGLWALVPDLHYLVPGPSGTVGAVLDGLGNLFWFHAAMDALVMGRGTRGNAGIALGLLVVCALVADASEWYRRRRAQ